MLLPRARRLTPAVTLACALAAVPPLATPASSAAVASGVTRRFIQVPYASGGRTKHLEAMLVQPARTGRYPLALISHGSPRTPADRSGMAPSAYTAIATDFARRGWASLAVMRRGYGESDGPWAEGFGTCDDPDYVKAGRASAEDLRQAIRYVSQHADDLAEEGAAIDASRVLLVGVSAGGFASMAANALPARETHVVGVLNFAGGRGSQEADEVCGEDALVEAFGEFGKTAAAPALFLYARNDHFFGPQLARQLFDAYRGAGGRGELVISPAYGTDGHGQFSELGASNWQDDVDRFLRAHRLPTWSTPVTDPVASLQPPAGLSANGLTEFRKYLASKNVDKAFAFGGRNAWGWRTGRRSPEEAAEAAVEACEANGATCQVYSVNNARSR